MISLKSEIISLIVLIIVLISAVGCGLFYYKPGIEDTSERADTGFIVAEVIDGDTLVIEGGERIRLIGINTPEEGQYFYREAKQALEAMVEGKNIKLESDISDLDQYGRLLRYVYKDNLFVNLEMVKRGFAHSYSYPPDLKHQDQLLQAQEYARQNSLGLWEQSSSPLEVKIQYDAPGDDSQNINQEYVIITNTSSFSMDVTGFTIKDRGTNIFKFPRFELQSGQTIFVHSGYGKNEDGHFYWNSDTPVWNNSGDTLFIRDREGLLVAIFDY